MSSAIWCSTNVFLAYVEMCLKCLTWNHSFEKFKNPEDNFKDAEKAHSSKHSQGTSWKLIKSQIIKGSQIKCQVIKASQIKFKKKKSLQIKGSQIKGSQIKDSQIKG